MYLFVTFLLCLHTLLHFLLWRELIQKHSKQRTSLLITALALLLPLGIALVRIFPYDGVAWLSLPGYLWQLILFCWLGIIGLQHLFRRRR